MRGLGTVQAYNTVTVHSRVDGELVKIGFVEGQDVKAGDVLAQIDPRPFRAQLDQATAKKMQDEAQLANAQRDLQRFMNLAQKQYATAQSVDTQKALVRQLDAAIKGDQAAIDNAKTQLDYTTITSPIDGRTGIRQIDMGNIIHATDPNGLVVMMTTMAAILSGLPLMLGTGTGSELRRPLGFAMVGGLIFSQALTLFTTPVIYLYLDRVNSWLTRRRHGEAHAEHRAATAPAD